MRGVEMVFASMLFVFFFLTANLISQLVLKTARGKNIAMLVFSLIFYSWSGPRYLFLLLGMVLICWLGALGIQRSRGKRERKRYLILTVALCLVILGVFKYTGFFLGTFQSLFGVPETIPTIVLPIGISFYTFQLISYVVDVYRRQVRAQEKYWVLLLYASLFHQCIAGPIVRYQDIRQDIIRRRATLGEISRGISRFTVGLAKKAILANGCAAIADAFFEVGPEELAAVPALGILLAAFAFTLQIYLDFSAYSDMAIGMGRMLGLHYPENFNYPYISRSVTEFWRRWHISLSSFFRDYVYIPLGGSRCSLPRNLLNLLVVWALTGLWHGASWNFVLWGLYFFVFLLLEKLFLKKLLDRLPLLSHLYLLLVVAVGWVLFRNGDLRLAAAILRGMVGLNGNALTNFSAKVLLKNNLYILIFSMLASTPLFAALGRAISRPLKRSRGGRRLRNLFRYALLPIAMLLLATMGLVGNSYNPFIYFQF